MQARTRTLSGWGNWPRARTQVVPVTDADGIGAALAAHDHLIARGLGRSYGDAAFLSRGATLVTEPADGPLQLDPASGLVDAWAGLPLDRLIDAGLPHGLFPPVVPGTRQVTLGGMLAADVHGKNHHRDGVFSRHVLDFDLRLADGTRQTVSRDGDPELFAATAGGMGLTGVIERVRLRLSRVPSAWLAVDVDRVPDFERALDLFHDSDARYEFSVAWIDCLARGRQLGRSVLLRGSWLPADALPRRRREAPLAARRPFPLGVPFPAPSWVLNRASITAFNEVYYRGHPEQARGVPSPLHGFFFPLDRVHRWNRLYGRRGFLQYQCVLPEETGRDGLRELLERLAAAGQASFLSVLKRFGPGEPDAMLSFPRAGYTLALDLPQRGGATLELLTALDRVVLDHGGRLYLAKDARLAPETFRAMYPEAERFLAVKRRVDPRGRFRSDLALRLGLV